MLAFICKVYMFIQVVRKLNDAEKVAKKGLFYVRRSVPEWINRLTNPGTGKIALMQQNRCWTPLQCCQKAAVLQLKINIYTPIKKGRHPETAWRLIIRCFRSFLLTLSKMPFYIISGWELSMKVVHPPEDSASYLALSSAQIPRKPLPVPGQLLDKLYAALPHKDKSTSHVCLETFSVPVADKRITECKAKNGMQTKLLRIRDRASVYCVVY
ncbi:AAEL008453-PA [Aedes aegypti]|uniref:AAEL008453-PA n=1 Tax=Aedes aegypti TaxID=7159 RepID=Q16YR6_AEDAE|nr:AAEL008453-PA [Aedes aegypti]